MNAPCGQEDCDCGHTIEKLEAETNFKEYNISCGCKAVRGAIVFTEICRKHLSQGAKPGRLMGDDYAPATIEKAKP